MAQFICGNDLKVLRFIATRRQVVGRELVLRFAASCDIKHVVAGLRDRGLVRQLGGSHSAAHKYSVTKDGKRQLEQALHTTS
ncbi:hypothetical protein [Allocoleopsis sp.]|uniref:hypothetical protein n=1 Tax=Allocoleopsis sp. TaxID=3088169 RepID=UPI002FCF74B6